MKNRETLLQAIIFSLSCFCYFYVIPTYTATIAMKNDFGPEMFPKFSMAVVMCGSFALLVKSLWNRPAASDSRRSPFNPRGGATAFGGVLFYILGVTFVGFYVSSFVLSALYLRKYDKKTYVIALGTNLLLFALIWFGFEKMMKVPLPTGLLF